MFKVGPCGVVGGVGVDAVGPRVLFLSLRGRAFLDIRMQREKEREKKDGKDEREKRIQRWMTRENKLTC